MNHSEIMEQVATMGLMAAVTDSEAETPDGRPAVLLCKAGDHELFTGFTSGDGSPVFAALDLIARFGPMYSSEAGRRGGSAKSERKAAASRANGKKGGRPRNVAQEGVK